MKQRPGGEEGLTLIELVISIVLMTMIAGALGAAFLTAATSSRQTAGRVRGSNDAQVIAAFLTRDAQSAGGIDPTTGMTDGSLGVFTNAVSDSNNACASVANPVVRFGWVDRSTAHSYDAVYSISGTTLERTFCIDGGTPATAPLAHDVATAVASCASGPCDDGNNGATSLPDSVSVTITETNTQNAPTPYSYTLSATVRSQPQSQQLSTSTAAAVPFLALGTGNCSGLAQAAGLDLGGTPTLKVYGGVVVNPSNGSCPPVFLHGSYTYTAAGLPYTQLTVADPFAALPTPSGTCHGGSNPAPVGGVYQPGVYPQALPASATLAAGVFVLCGGLNASLTATSGTMLYVAQGAINISGGTTKVNAPSSGPYAGVAIWQAASDTSPVTVSGNAVLDLGSPGGALYAPNAEVDLIGTANFTIQVLVAKVVFIQGTHTVSVGTPPPSLPTIQSPNSASLASGRVGVAYSTTVGASGGSGRYTWSAVLPPGLSINPSTGVISGTPQTPVTNFAASVTVTDALGDVYVRPYTITILDRSTLASATPNTQDQGWSGTVTITGTNLDSGARVTSFGGGITISNSTDVNSTTVTAQISIASNATPGARTVTVTNGDGSAASGLIFTVAPLPTITSVTLADRGGGTPGRIEQGDTITVVFSSQMSVASLCSTWSGDTSNHSLTGNNDVTVTLTDGPGATNDTIKVASATCTFNFGTLDLGSSAYVSAASLTFKGTGNNNKSTINWTASTHTLVIKLGQQAGTGTTAVVATSTPKYTVPAAVTDSNGGSVSNSPYPLPNGRQF